MTLRVAILGPGRAGRSLANAFAAAGIEASLVGRGQRVPRADAVLVTVRDDDLPAALDSLTTLPADTVVLHASGVTDVDRVGAHPTGTFHPLVPLANPDAGETMMRGAWIGVDGDAEAIAIARRLAGAIGAHVLEIPPGAKAGYHAAAVIASNFPIVLAAAAEREMRRLGVDPETAHGAVAHLMWTSIEHVEALAPERALTGPVSRGDVGTIERNLAALADDPAVRDLYVAATRIAIEIARAAGTDPARLSEIQSLLFP